MKYYFYFSDCKNNIYEYTFRKSIMKENSWKQVQNVSLEFSFVIEFPKVFYEILFSFF